MKAIYLAAALLFSALAFTPASAAPVAHVNGASSTSSSVLPVQYHRDRNRHRYERDRYRSRYRAGHRYRHAPRGWHRYYNRPRSWRNRGCVMVGPVWFCP